MLLVLIDAEKRRSDGYLIRFTKRGLREGDRFHYVLNSRAQRSIPIIEVYCDFLRKVCEIDPPIIFCVGNYFGAKYIALSAVFSDIAENFCRAYLLCSGCGIF